ncbi:MAG: CHAT domain-containing protein [Acidobacteriota bacterium]
MCRPRLATVVFLPTLLVVSSLVGLAILTNRSPVDKQSPGWYKLLSVIGRPRLIEARLAGIADYGPCLTEFETERDLLARNQLTNSSSSLSLALIVERNHNTRGFNDVNGSDLLRLWYEEIFALNTAKRTGEMADTQFTSAQAQIFSENAEHPSPQNSRALALLYLAKGQISKAVNTLEIATRRSPHNVLLLNDLAALYFTRAQYQNQPLDLLNAFSTVNTALAINPKLKEAGFNRALILERLQLTTDARKAWQEYLALEQSAEWTREAQAHNAKLAMVEAWQAWPAEKERLTRAALTDEEKLVEDIVQRFPHPARVYAINELLPSWADAHFNGQLAVAIRARKTAAAIGVALSKLQDDRFISAAIAAIDTAEQAGSDSRQLIDLINAHHAYREGREIVDQADAEKAIPLLDKAIKLFHQAGDPAGETIALLQRARCDNVRRRFKEALASLDRVRTMAEQKSYQYLIGRALWTTGHIRLSQLEISFSLDASRNALRYLKACGDMEGTAVVYSNISDTLNKIGEATEMWEHSYRAITYINKTSNSAYQAPVLMTAANNIRKLAKLTEAIYFHNESIRVALANGDKNIISNAFRQRSLTYHQLNNFVAAENDLAQAKRYCTNPTVQMAISIAEGDYKLDTDPKGAVELFTKLLKDALQAEYHYPLTRLYLSRAHAYLALGDRANADADLNSSLKEFERKRESLAEEGHRIAFLGEHQPIYDEMIKFQLTQYEQEEVAFDYAERARGRALLDILDAGARTQGVDSAVELILQGTAKPFSLAQIQQAMPAGTTLIEYAALDDRLFAWIIEHGRVEPVESPLPARDIDLIASRLQTAIVNNAPFDELKRLSAPLYDLIIRPLIRLKPQNNLIIVPDKGLYNVPFAAIINPDSDRYLIEDFTIAFAPSATVFIRCLALDQKKTMKSGETSAVVIGTTKFNRTQFPNLSELPWVEREAKKIVNYYAANVLPLIGEQATEARVLAAAGNYTIVHFAGHAMMNNGLPLHSKLILAPNKTSKDSYDDGVLHAYELYGQTFPNTRLVVLAACQTAAGQDLRGEGIANLARPFLAASVPAVIGSLWNVDDRATAKLFILFHQQHSAGTDVVKALRSAQLSLLNSSDKTLNSPAMWAPFILLGGVTTINN